MLKKMYLKIGETIKADLDIKLLYNLTLFTLLFGFIVHGFNFFNTDYAHDGLISIDQWYDIEWKISLGRFMQPLSILTRGCQGISLICGTLSLLYTTLAVYTLFKALGVTHRFNYFLFCALIITSSLYSTTNLDFAHELDAFMLGFLFASFSVYVYVRFNRGYLVSPIFIAISCGFYQAFMSVTIVSFMIMIKLLDGNNTKEVMKAVYKSLLTIFLGGFFYILCYKAVALIANIATDIDSYNSIENVFVVTRDYWLYLYETYKAVFFYLLVPPLEFRKVPNIGFTLLLMLYLFTAVIRTARKNNLAKTDLLLLVLLVLLLPLGANLVCLLNKGLVSYLLSMGSFMFYAFLLIMLERMNEPRLLKYGIYTLLFAMIFNGFIFVNSAYVERSIKSKATYAIMNNVYTDISTNESYLADMDIPFYFEGSVNNLHQLNYHKKFNNVISYIIPQQSYFVHFFNTALRVYNTDSYKVMDDVTLKQIQPQIDQMPCYPYVGYLKEINGIMVVKFPTKPQ